MYWNYVEPTNLDVSVVNADIADKSESKPNLYTKDGAETLSNTKSGIPDSR